MPILGKPAAAVAAGLAMLAVGPASASIASPRGGVAAGGGGRPGGQHGAGLRGLC
jgi:hypothetical protein